MSYKRQLPAANKHDITFRKLTIKQWAVYYWFISKSYWNSLTEEKHYFLYKSDVVNSKIAKELNIGSVNTVKTAIEKLIECNYLYYDDKREVYLIPHQKVFTYIDIKLLKFLLAYSKYLDAEILLYYSVLKRYNELCIENGELTRFNTRFMIELIGHNVTDDSIYKKYQLYLMFLTNFNIITVEEKLREKNGGVYVQYILTDIKETVTAKCEYIDDKVEPSQKIVDDIKEQIESN